MIRRSYGRLRRHVHGPGADEPLVWYEGAGTADRRWLHADNLGRRTSLTRGNGTVTGYGYDAVSRLTGLTNELAGTANDLALGFTHNPAGRLPPTPAPTTCSPGRAARRAPPRRRPTGSTSSPRRGR